MNASPPTEMPTGLDSRHTEQVAQLKELADAAAATKSLDDRLEGNGFTSTQPHFRARGATLIRSVERTSGPVTVREDVEFPHEFIDLSPRSLPPELGELQREYLEARFDPNFGATRFACGKLWYTLRMPWTPERLAAARSAFGLGTPEDYARVERSLHFHFQRLYRKPPDEWTESEAAEWELICSFIDVDAYQKDNPPTENRIGHLIKADSERIVIRWNSAGEILHDTRAVPPDLISAAVGSVIHAEFEVGKGSDIWLWIRIEPPFTPDECGTDDAASGGGSTLPDADWPKIEN